MVPSSVTMPPIIHTRSHGSESREHGMDPSSGGCTCITTSSTISPPSIAPFSSSTYRRELVRIEDNRGFTEYAKPNFTGGFSSHDRGYSMSSDRSRTWEAPLGRLDHARWMTDGHDWSRTNGRPTPISIVSNRLAGFVPSMFFLSTNSKALWGFSVVRWCARPGRTRLGTLIC